MRGTSVALYNYADYNEKILGNTSIIMAKPDDNLNKSKDKFTSRFEVNFSYFNGYDTQKYIIDNNIDYLYVIKEGTQADGIVLKETPTLVHSVFRHNDPHGHKYAYISNWLAEDQGYDPYTHSVPHMVEKLPQSTYNLRDKLGIPKNKTVFGYYGGSEEFNIAFAKETVIRVAKEREDIVFLFMNIQKFGEEVPNVIFLKGTWVLEEKAAFVRACDALLHARAYGETFGLVCGEFSLENKPVITYGGSEERAHIQIIGERGILYNTQEQLYDVLHNLDTYIKYDDYYTPYLDYSPEIIMETFKRVFIGQ